VGATARRRATDRAADPGAARPSVATHPAAQDAVRRLRAGAALLAAVAVALLGLRAGVPPFDLALRALGAGVAAHLVAWAAGIAFWRQVVLAELREEAERRRAAREEREAERREQLGAA
jgi:hypothetical protein